MSDTEFPTDTVATHELKQIHRSKLLGAEPQLIQIEGVAQTLALMSGSDAFNDDVVARSMAFLAGTLMDESRKLRERLYE